MNTIKLKARAKINIALDVLSKRPDGYHDVRMIMQTIDLYDKLTMSKIKRKEIRIKTNLKYLPTDQRNLVYQIIEYIMENHNIDTGVQVDLFKMIPVAAGLAGGSSDAASTIHGMNALFELDLTNEEMKKIGKRFGADIPYCIDGGTMLAEGIGEVLTELPPFPESYVVIAKPKFSVSTAYVYRNLSLDKDMVHPQVDDVILAIKAYRKDLIGALMGNVLEDVTVKEYPQIGEIKEAFLNLGAYGALMSGSGPTVFGLFDNKLEAAKAKKAIMKRSDIQFSYMTEIYNRK